MSEESDNSFLIIVYVWCGLLSGVWIILAICTVALWVHVRRISRKANHRPSMYLNNPRAISTKPSSDYSYGDPSVMPGEELARRGFSAHTPNRSKPQVPDNVSYSSNFTTGGVPSLQRLPPLSDPPRGRSDPNFIY